MTTLHGSWILEPGYLFIWGETWRSVSSYESATLAETPSPYPYAMTEEELQQYLKSHFGEVEFSADWQTQGVTLPSIVIKNRTKNKPLLPLSSDRTIPQDATLQPWTIGGYRLSPENATQLLQALPLGLSTPKTAFANIDLQFWAQVYRWSLDLIARSKFLPGVCTTATGEGMTCWLPLLDSRTDQERLRDFSQNIAPPCLSYQQQPEATPQELILGFLSNIINAQVQSWTEANLALSKDTEVFEWARSLSGEEVSLEASSIDRFTKVLENWTTPIQNYLVNPLTHQLGENPYRLCFTLIPPTDGEMNWGHSDWKLQYSLQAVDDPNFLIPSEIVWQNPVDELDYQGRVIEEPQETLLKNLGLAVRLYEPIGESLEKDLPTHSLLNPIEVYTFIRGKVWQLQNSGFGINLPPGLEQGEEKRLGIKITAQVEPQKGQSLGLKSLLQYKLELAVGEATLSKAEFERLLEQKSPLVKVKSEWIALQPADVKAAQEILATKSQENLSVEDAVRLTMGEERAFAKLPVVDFEAKGVLDDLLAALNNNQKLEPISTPEDFHGELRPYQARGVSWLAFLEKWSLGACLADDMGLGKCITPESLVFINGDLKSAVEIWDNYAGEELFDGEGFWTTPTKPLLVNAINEETGKIIQSPINKLYRQKVSEKLHKISLKNGSNITITKRHKLLTNRGWTNQFKIGDQVGVPSRLNWQGKAEDEDLVKFHARKIATGNETKKIPSFIMQSDIDTVRLFLINYFSAKDSVVFKNQSLEITVTSSQLMQQISTLLRRLGIWLQIKCKVKQLTNSQDSHADYIGTIEGDAAKRFLAEIGISNAKKQNQLEAIFSSNPEKNSKTNLLNQEVFYSPITSIEEIDYQGWVYDFEVQQHHNFVANNIICHNTIQMIAFLLNLRKEEKFDHPTLLICPTSVLTNWEREVKRFAPSLSTLVHHGDKRHKGKTFAKAVEKKNLVITSYPLVYRDLDTLKAVNWQGVVLDEAQNVKNPQAKQSQAVRQFNPGFRIALTGTPVENRLSELWSILDFLNPNYLGDKQFFQRRFAVPIEKYGDRDSLQTLRSLVQPFILRRLKTDKEIIQDLPEKQEMTVFCGLSAEQAAIYQKLVEDSLKEIEDTEGIKRRGLILTLLLRLKQVCNHPAQYLKQKQIDSASRSGKLQRLVEILEEMIEEGDHGLIFTQFAEWGKLLQTYLQQKLGVEASFLYGSTSKKQREEMIDRFQNDPDAPPILILSLKAGGTGLNLTRANHVFHIDRWWNPAVENQATDRAFRIGQTRNVQVHKFVCTGTLEERIHEMIESKKQLAEQTVDAGEQWVTELDTDQLRNLLLLDQGAIMED